MREPNKLFHQKKLVDGLLNFEMHETTCSYMLRNPNVFLNGDSFGQRLFDKIYQQNKNLNSILEIGAGLGHLAKEFINRSSKVTKKNLDYTIIDLSPELIKNQRKTLKAKKIKWIEGDVLEFSKHIKKATYDVVIANEMLADLPVEILENKQKVNNLNNFQVQTIKNFQEDFKGKVFIPKGLLTLLTGIKPYCHSNSKIILSEYFTRHGGGSLLQLHNHQEYKLNLNLTAELIRNEGFDVEVVSMIDYLDFNLNVKPLSKELTKFFSDHLGVLKSRTVPFSEKELKKNIDINEVDFSASAFNRAEWISIFSNYYFLILTPKLAEASLGKVLSLKIYKNNEITLLKSGKKNFLISNNPVKAVPINRSEEMIWKSIKSGMTVKKLVNQDLVVLGFIKKLEEMHFLSFK